jgi:CBS domain containing-hemolysin-like protein
MKAFWPFIRLLNGAGRLVVNLLGLRSRGGHAMVHSEEELKMLVTASQEAGVLEETEEQMLHRVFGFADLTAGQVMVPRTELVGIPAATPVRDVAAIVANLRETRFPVYRNDLDDVVGMLHVNDVLRSLTADSSAAAATVARETLTVPESLGAGDLLAEMRRRRVREALVIDEYGGTAGMVTFESLMERIVGDVPNEPGAETGRIVAAADGSAEIDGLTLVADVNVRFGLHIDEDVYTTIGGYVLGRLGRRAKIGDTIDIENRRMRVETLDGLRVSRVLLSKPNQSTT